ncbi:hypothetical protein HFU84_08440 [Acidithiobacillus sp. CV18-2]|nr:hypothetical protein [Acidithiobacillus sp. BN09-2]MBU2777530.1 hypothetical protein [Acidithiobacillus sp. CV18-2]MBU2799630.1 hypothetical protein [Acidithiobacillus sp. VAN18-4]
MNHVDPLWQNGKKSFLHHWCRKLFVVALDVTLAVALDVKNGGSGGL